MRIAENRELWNELLELSDSSNLTNIDKERKKFLRKLFWDNKPRKGWEETDKNLWGNKKPKAIKKKATFKRDKTIIVTKKEEVVFKGTLAEFAKEYGINIKSAYKRMIKKEVTAHGKYKDMKFEWLEEENE